MKRKNGILFLVTLFLFGFTLFLFSCKNNSKHEIVYNNLDSTIASEIFHLPGNIDSEIDYDYWIDDNGHRGLRKGIVIVRKKNDEREYFYDRMYDSAGTEILYSFDNDITGIDYTYQPKWGGGNEDNMEIEIKDDTNSEFRKNIRYCVIKEKGQLRLIIYEKNFGEMKKEGLSQDQHYDSLGQIDMIDISKRHPKMKDQTYFDTTFKFETQEKKLAFKDTLLDRINKIKSGIVLPVDQK